MAVEELCQRCERSRDERPGDYVALCRKCWLLLAERPSRESIIRKNAMIERLLAEIEELKK